MNLVELAQHRHEVEHNSQNSWWIHDVRGIPLCRVCEECESAAKATYKPEVLGEGEGSYEDVVEEPIEPEE